MDLAELIQLRKSVGATQAKFAEHMGLPKRTYEDIEAGKSALRPVHEIAARFARDELLQLRSVSGGRTLVTTVVDRHGDIVGPHGEELLVRNEDPVERIRAAQAEFEISGFNPEHGYWWARNSGEPFRLYKWWIEG